MTLVQRLVDIDSPSGREAEVAQALLAEMGARGYRARLDDAGNAVGAIGHGSRVIALVGHLDTVPGHIPVRIEDGKLYGRGSVDAKGCLAAFVEAASCFAGSESLTVEVVGCVEEEAYSRGARHLLAHHPAPDCVVIGEPSGWAAVTLGYKGSISLQYALEKPRTHLGAAETTSVEDAVAFYNALCDTYPERGAGFEDLSLNLRAIQTEAEGNVGRVTLDLNVRTPPGFDAEAFRRTVETLRDEASVCWTDWTPAVLADKRNPLVRAFLSGIRTQNGVPRFKRKTGTSDMNLLSAWGCPILAYGPGDSSLDHTPDEHLELEEYERAIAVLRHALASLEAFYAS